LAINCKLPFKVRVTGYKSVADSVEAGGINAEDAESLRDAEKEMAEKEMAEKEMAEKEMGLTGQ
jgi:hypothetical protein